jgi:3-hydroxyacyl-[acyl-carrier-protein] dehydratase
MTRVDFEFTVPNAHPSLAGHFPGNPIVPGVLLLDCVMDALQRAGGAPVVHLQRVKFLSALRPDETARGSWEVDGTRASFRATADRDGVPVKIAEGVCHVAERSAS